MDSFNCGNQLDKENKLIEWLAEFLLNSLQKGDNNNNICQTPSRTAANSSSVSNNDNNSNNIIIKRPSIFTDQRFNSIQRSINFDNNNFANNKKRKINSYHHEDSVDILLSEVTLNLKNANLRRTYN